MERLNEKRSGGLSRRGLRLWGLFFLAAGIVGRSIFQNRLLGIGTVSGAQLMEQMEGSEEAMIIATIALILQAVETCAVPIFSFLLVDGFQRTSDFGKYAMRVAGMAVLSEIPYNLATSGSMTDLGSRNPAFGLVLGLILLYFYRRYGEKRLQNTVIRIMVFVAAVAWAVMLRVEYGVAQTLLICVLWIFRRKAIYQNFIGVVAAVACSLTSPFFMASPMSFLVVHFYNGEKGTENRVMSYLAYPVLLLVVGILAKTL